MTPSWRILAAVDLSNRADESVQHARALAAAVSADLDLLYVVDVNPEDVQANLQNLRDCAGLSHPHLRWHVLQGSTASTIAAHAETIDADMLFLTSRTYGNWSRFWRRSVTKDVLRMSMRSVCIGGSRIDGDFRVRNHRILCVLGLDGRETALVQHARDVAERTSSELILLHVIPEPNEALLSHTVDNGSRPLSRERAIKDIGDLISALGMPAVTSVMVGDPGKCIPLAAREHSVDLVLMSRPRAKSYGVYSNYLERVSRRLRCPLLTVSVDTHPSLPSMIDNERASLRTANTALSQPVHTPRIAHEPISAAMRPSTSPPDSAC